MSTTELLRVSCTVSDGLCQVQLVGEADFSVLGDLDDVLQGVDLRPGLHVRLDVAGLEFIDVACMRALVRFASRAESAGADVQMVHSSASFALLRDVLGVEVLGNA